VDVHEHDFWRKPGGTLECACGASKRPLEPAPDAPVVEQCRGCEGPVLLAELTEEDDLPLCNRHWSQWVARFLNSVDAPGCWAHLIREPHDSETGQSA